MRSPRCSSSRAGAVHDDGALGLRVADAAQARLRPGRHRQQPVRQQAGRHRARSSSSNGRRGQYMRFDRNPDYWQAGPALSRPHRRALHRRRADAQRGDGDRRRSTTAAFSAIPHLDVERLAEAAAHRRRRRTATRCSRRSWMLDFNTRMKPFDDVKVRQAIAYAIDRKFVVDNIWFGFGKPATGPISSNFKAERHLHHRRQELQRAERRRHRQQDARRGRLQAQGGWHALRDHPRYHAVRRRVAALRRVRQAGAGARSGSRRRCATRTWPTWLRRVYTDYDFQFTSNWLQNLADPVIGVDRQYSRGRSSRARCS